MAVVDLFSGAGGKPGGLKMHGALGVVGQPRAGSNPSWLAPDRVRHVAGPILDALSMAGSKSVISIPMRFAAMPRGLLAEAPWRRLAQPSYAFYRSPASGLFLPWGHSADLGRPDTQTIPSSLEKYHVTVSWSDLHGSVPTYSDVVDRLRKYGLDLVLAAIELISMRMSRPGHDDVLAGQGKLISFIFDDPGRLSDDIEAWRKGDADSETLAPPIVRVFHDLQIVAATKIALLAVPLAPTGDPSSLHGLGEALLMITDLVDRHTKSRELSSRTLEGANLDRWVSYFVRNHLFHPGGNPPHALARSYEMYLTDRLHLRDKASYVNLPDLFERITTVPPDLAWAAMFSVLASGKTDHIERLRLSPDERRAIFTLFAATADVLRQELKNGGFGPDSLQPYDPLPLSATPVVLLDDEAYCPSALLLRRKMTRGLFHIFLSGLSDRDESKRFLDYMGVVFEDYVDTLLRRVFPPESGRYVGVAQLDEVVHQGRKKCDGLIIYEDSVVLLEAKATLLPLSVWAAGNVADLSAKIDDIIGDSAEQFDGTIRLIEEGRLRDVGADPSRITNYLPVVVTLETMPDDFMAFQFVERRMRGQMPARHRKAKALQLADVGALESLENLLAEGISLRDILIARLEDQSYREDSLRNWLIRRYGDAGRRPSPYLEKRLHEIVGRAREVFGSRSNG